MVDLLKDWNPNKYMVEVENEDGLLDKRGHHKKFQRKNNTKSANPR